MRFAFTADPALPRLAWCARLERGSDRVHVRHGPWVETGADGFVEGAWDGAFGEGRFDAASSFAGSGGRATSEGVVFATPTNLIDRLHSLRVDDELFVSNSLVFLLVAAGDAPDLAYPYYYYDLLDHYRSGSAAVLKQLRTRSGRHVRLHDFQNVAIDAGLSIERQVKASPEPPRDYADYVDRLSQAMRRVCDNAADPRRRVVYRPAVLLSRGYDSTAVAVLARRLGCREALCFRGARADDSDDSGGKIGERLGYEVNEFRRRAYRDLSGMPEVEFWASPMGSHVTLAAAAEQLEAKLQISGTHGDAMWTTDSSQLPRAAARPGAGSMFGQGVTEFRLRVGFVNYPPVCWGCQHPRAVHGISVSQELRPWSVGGDYDRPIPRRIAEEAGIPREWFGNAKAAMTHVYFRYDTHLDEASREDFRKFLESSRRGLRLGLRHRVLHRIYRLNRRANRGLEAMARRLGRQLTLTPLLDGRYRHRQVPTLFTFHWSFERLRERYEERATPGGNRAA
jgi:hypothetical protein